MPKSISYSILEQQSADTSNALIDYWSASPKFQNLAQYEGNMTKARDDEDASKLQVGIDFAKSKGVIDPDFKPEPYVEIDVLGKTPTDVANEIISHCGTQNGSGSVIVLCGLSGTGKVCEKKQGNSSSY